MRSIWRLGGGGALLSVFDTAAADDTLADFAVFLDQAGFADELRGDGPFTLIAPDQEAFNKLTPEERANFFNEATFRLSIEFFIIDTFVPESDLRQTDLLTNKIGKTIAVVTDGDDIVLMFLGRQARVIRSDILGTNGVLHVIDSVIGI